MVRSLNMVESALASAIGQYVESAAPTIEAERDVAAGVAALFGVLVGGDDRWPRFWWVDDALPEWMRRTSPSAVEMSGRLIIGDERNQWIEPFRARVAISGSGDAVETYDLEMGDQELGLGAVLYGERRRHTEPDPAGWMFSFHRGDSNH